MANPFLLKSVSHFLILFAQHRLPCCVTCSLLSLSYYFLSLPTGMEAEYVQDFILLIDWWERERERERFVVPLIYTAIGWFLYVPWPGIELATLAYWEDVLTNWATQPGLNFALLYKDVFSVPRVVPNTEGNMTSTHWPMHSIINFLCETSPI